MLKLHKSVNRNKLLYKYVGNNNDNYFSTFINSKSLYDMIGENQKKLKSNLADIKFGGRKNDEQREVIKKVENLSDSRQAVIDFYNDYPSMVINAAYGAKQQEGKGLKILTPKQIFQRLSVALAQIQAGNNSKILLNEIRQIVYSLYQSK